MKIGILTYHRSHNYGALLQAIATRVVLERLGHEVHYIDYWPGYHKRVYAMVNPKLIFTWNIISALKYIKGLCVTYKTKYYRRQVMLTFISKYIEPYCSSITDSYDIIVYGSDQIWRKQPENVGYNPVYFGLNGFSALKHIAYAASMGVLPTSDKDKKCIKNLVSHLDAISVREKSLADLLTTLDFADVNICLDPTLLLDKELWNKIIPVQKYEGSKYALFYDLQMGAFLKDQVKLFAEKHGLELKTIYGCSLKKEDANNICSISADGFLNLVRNAEFIFTSSFHGLVFAILYGKPFYASFSKNSGRAESLLVALNLKSYLLPAQSQIPTIPYKKIDYIKVYNNMSTYRINSIKYLENNCK